ncbi:MAG: hypothetical protein Q8O00_11975, partial [Holophaga sp.]|nr:hypothetical protein [Holophaga sp.]
CGKIGGIVVIHVNQGIWQKGLKVPNHLGNRHLFVEAWNQDSNFRAWQHRVGLSDMTVSRASRKVMNSTPENEVEVMGMQSAFRRGLE